MRHPDNPPTLYNMDQEPIQRNKRRNRRLFSSTTGNPRPRKQARVAPTSRRHHQVFLAEYTIKSSTYGTWQMPKFPPLGSARLKDHRQALCLGTHRHWLLEEDHLQPRHPWEGDEPTQERIARYRGEGRTAIADTAIDIGTRGAWSAHEVGSLPHIRHHSTVLRLAGYPTVLELEDCMGTSKLILAVPYITNGEPCPQDRT
jgi:hypothetical protein